MESKVEYTIVPITLAHLEGFRAAVDSVAREKKYLSFLEGPPFAMSKEFVEKNIKENWPHVVPIVDNTVVGWCDITSNVTSLNRLAYAHSGELGIVESYLGKGIGKALMYNALDIPNYQDIWEAKDFALMRIAQDNYLLKYTLIQNKIRVTRRSTIWRRENAMWKILYHQGTVINE